MRLEPNWAGIEAVGQQAVAAFNEKMQPVLDELHGQYKGRPIDVVRQALVREWRKVAGEDLPDPMVTTIATQISEGKSVELRIGG